MEEKAIGRNKVVRHSKKEEKMKDANKNMFEISFFNQGIINCN